MTARAVIAHISDLHFGHHDKRVADALRDDLVKEVRPDFIAVTGDLSELAWGSQFDQAKEFLREIVTALADKGQSTRVIVIPGNHDVSPWKGHGAWEKAFAQWNVGGIGGVCRPGTLESFHQRNSKGDQTKAEDLAKKDWKLCEYYPECQLAFLKFDSNQLAPGPLGRLDLSWYYRNYARGHVGLTQIADMKAVLDRYKQEYPAGRKEPAFEDARRIALVHHHVHYLPNVGSDSIVLMLNAGIFWRTMIELGVELLLHGHKHYATHAVIRYMAQDNGRRRRRDLMVLAAGTALRSEDGPNGNSYYRLDADVLSCRIQQRKHQDVRFEDDGPKLVFQRDVDVEVPGTEFPIDGAALDAMLTPNEIDYVHNVEFEEIHYVGTIDKDLGYGMEVTYAGNLLRGELFLAVPLVVINAPARERALSPVVTDLLARPNKTIKGVKIEKHKQNVRKLVIQIPLPKTNPGDRFKLCLSIYTPGMMYESNDFDAKGLLRYRHGPEQFSYVLRSEREFVGVRCFAVHRSGLRPLELAEQTRDNNGFYVVRPKIDSVAALGGGVLCHYHELLPMPANPAPIGTAT